MFVTTWQFYTSHSPITQHLYPFLSACRVSAKLSAKIGDWQISEATKRTVLLPKHRECTYKMDKGNTQGMQNECNGEAM